MHTSDEVVILPGTAHEVLQKKHRARSLGEDFELLVRVHSLDCYGAADKFVQLEPDGEWRRWSDLSKEDQGRACKKQG